MSFDPSPFVSKNISRDEVIELKRAFDIFDEDGSGTIEPSELKAAFEELNIRVNQKMIYQVLGELDKENRGGFTFADFFKFAIARPQKESRAEIMRAFKLFDFDGEGRISWTELKRVALDLGEDVDDEHIKKMFANADLDNDGFVTQEDFYNIMTGKVYFD